MSAKEELLAAVEALSEAEAADTLEMIARRQEGLENAGVENAGVNKAKTKSEPGAGNGEQPDPDQPARGDNVSIEQVRAEFSRQRS
jgi:hypothetical protein